MSDWFFMVGEPLAEHELAQVQAYLQGLGLRSDLPVETVRGWLDVRSTIEAPDWDQRWWDAEQAERARLSTLALDSQGGGAFRVALLNEITLSSEAIHGAAAVEAARGGCASPSLIRAAAGAATEALYLARLAELAEQGPEHPFAVKRALFDGGHWPLGILNDRYYVF